MICIKHKDTYESVHIHQIHEIFELWTLTKRKEIVKKVEERGRKVKIERGRSLIWV